jgi:hypothetical protein
MKEEARQSACDIQICPRSSTNPGKQKILTFCSAAPRQTSATVAPPSALPRNCDAPFSTLPEFVSPFTFVLYGIPKRPFVVRIPCHRKDSTTVGKMPPSTRPIQLWMGHLVLTILLTKEKSTTRCNEEH